MKITETRVTILKNANENKLKAFASITIDSEFVVGGLKIVEGKGNDLFVAMPSNKGSDGEYYDIAFPLSKDLRDKITDIVIDAYREEQRANRKKPQPKRPSRRAKRDDDEDELPFDL